MSVPQTCGVGKLDDSGEQHVPQSHPISSTQLHGSDRASLQVAPAHDLLQSALDDVGAAVGEVGPAVGAAVVTVAGGDGDGGGGDGEGGGVGPVSHWKVPHPD